MFDGARLQQLRKMKGLDVKELSRLSGVGANALWHLESGRRYKPYYETVVKLAGALGVSLDDFRKVCGDIYVRDTARNGNRSRG